MIACPICGRATIVVETRARDGGDRRRRKCAEATCAGRVTTVEVVVDGRRISGRVVLVSRRSIAQLQRLIAALGGAA